MAGFDDFTDQKAIFEKLIADPENQVCFDCGAKNVTSASIWFGVYLCDGCANVHWVLPHEIGMVRSIDDQWLPTQLVMICNGGNKRARFFFKQHGWTGGGDIEAKYRSEAATLYKRLLLSALENTVMALPSSAFSKDKNLEIKETDVARKRFPNAKSISSAQFLGDKENMDEKNTNDTEAKISLQKFSTSTAISSADLFGRGVNDSPICSIQNWIKSIFSQDKLGN